MSHLNWKHSVVISFEMGQKDTDAWPSVTYLRQSDPTIIWNCANIINNWLAQESPGV